MAVTTITYTISDYVGLVYPCPDSKKPLSCAHHLKIHGMNLTGMIPIFGVYAARERIDSLCDSLAVARYYNEANIVEKDSLGAKIFQVVRALFEFFSLGWLLVLLIDVPVDCYRYFNLSSSPSCTKGPRVRS